MLSLVFVLFFPLILYLVDRDFREFFVKQIVRTNFGFDYAQVEIESQYFLRLAGQIE